MFPHPSALAMASLVPPARPAPAHAAGAPAAWAPAVEAQAVEAASASLGSPLLWTVTIAAVAALLLVDFLITRRPHEVSMREAMAWSGF